MPTLEIDEYSGAATVNGSTVPVYSYPITTQKITTSASSQRSSALNVDTRICSLKAVGGNLRVAFGGEPTASTSTKLLSTSEVYDIAVKGGDKIAVIDA